MSNEKDKKNSVKKRYKISKKKKCLNPLTFVQSATFTIYTDTFTLFLSKHFAEAFLCFDTLTDLMHSRMQ